MTILKSSTYFIFIPFLIFATYSTAQSKHTTHWYFGDNAGLDFSSGTPIAFGNTGMKTYEGSTSYSDENGNLLFYSNGIQVLDDTAAVWNRNQQIMPNGILSDFTGHASTIQSSIVVPVPGSTTQYYLFTLDGYENYDNPEYKGLTYSIIDMTLDGGLGDVINKATSIISPAIPYLSEQMIATKHANGTDYWLILHENNYMNLLTNKFIIYQISTSGIGLPITQNIGMNESPGMQGSMQVSSQGDKIAFNKEVFDFDNATGILSNPLATGNSWGYREFSRDGRFLYVSKMDYGLYQYDLESISLSESEFQLSSYGSFGQIQIGLDNKIYVAMAYDGGFQPYLSVINNPEQQGVSCNFSFNTINLVNGVSMMGLPNFIDFVPVDHTGIDKTEHDNHVSLYPNPATSSFMLKFNNNEQSMVTVTDIHGKVVIIKTALHSGNSIDLSLIKSGSYFVEIEINSDIHRKRLIVE